MADLDRQLLLSHSEESEHCLLARISGLSADDSAAASALPGWTRGHVLTHLARNAETFADAFDGVRRGEVLSMYGGSVESRNADIEAGAARGAAELIDDVQRTSSRFLQGLRTLADPDWSGHIRHLRGGLLSIEEVVWMRRQEVEIHHLDLALGYRPEDWPADFVEFNLPRQLQRLPERAPDVVAPDLLPHDLLAWLYGRGGPTLPDLPPWP